MDHPPIWEVDGEPRSGPARRQPGRWYRGAPLVLEVYRTRRTAAWRGSIDACAARCVGAPRSHQTVPGATPPEVLPPPCDTSLIASLVVCSRRPGRLCEHQRRLDVRAGAPADPRRRAPMRPDSRRRPHPVSRRAPRRSSGSAAPSGGASTVTITAQNIAFTTPDVSAPAAGVHSSRSRTRTPACPTTSSIKDAAGRERLQDRHLPGRRDAGRTTSRRSPPAPTRSTARSTRR